ncbi:hypothetical protein BR93DRAFT_442546 [Coniochaeta sp. PMI_546]|nr:hypothetical protein BR93DRAFT_442546 [Coniochaeta sp. PMI_546]
MVGSQEKILFHNTEPASSPELASTMTRDTRFTAVSDSPTRPAGDRFCLGNTTVAGITRFCRYALSKGFERAKERFDGRRQSERPECVSLPPAVTSPKHRVKERETCEENYTWIQTRNDH